MFILPNLHKHRETKLQNKHHIHRRVRGGKLDAVTLLRYSSGLQSVASVTVCWHPGFNTLILTITTVMWARTWLMLTLAPDRHFTSTPYVHTTWNSAMWHMSLPPQPPGPRGTCQSRPTWNKCSHHWHGTIKKDVSESLSKWLRCSRNRWFRFISRHSLLHSGVVLNYQTILVGIKGPLRTLD